MTPNIDRSEPLLETLGVQNSSFEFKSVFFTLLVEEKGEKIDFGNQILVFGQNSLFFFPVEENAPRAIKSSMSRGHSGEGAEPRRTKREPCPEGPYREPA